MRISNHDLVKVNQLNRMTDR